MNDVETHRATARQTQYRQRTATWHRDWKSLFVKRTWAVAAMSESHIRGPALCMHLITLWILNRSMKSTSEPPVSPLSSDTGSGGGLWSGTVEDIVVSVSTIGEGVKSSPVTKNRNRLNALYPPGVGRRGVDMVNRATN